MHINLSNKIILVNQDSMDENILKKLSFSKVVLKSKIVNVAYHDTLPTRKSRIFLCFTKEDVQYAEANQLDYYFITTYASSTNEHEINRDDAMEYFEKWYRYALLYYYGIPNVTYLILIVFVLLKLYFIIPYWIVLFIIQFIFCKYQIITLRNEQS